MSDEFGMKDEEKRPEDAASDELEAAEEIAQAGFAEAEEAMAADEEFMGVAGAEGEVDPAIHEALAEAHRSDLHARAWWSHVHKEHLTLLFANCLLFAGVLAAWDRPLPWDVGDVRTFSGLQTIRGAAIFALAIYGFWTAVFNIWYRQLKLRPYVLGALLGLWVGIGGIMATVGTARWDGASEWLKTEKTSVLMGFLTPLSSIAPGFWLLTAGGLLVFFVLLKGVMGGRAQAKAAGRAAGGSRRRRR